MLRWKSLFADALNSRRLPKGVRRKQRAQAELSRRSRLETLEDRRMLTTPMVSSVTPSDMLLADDDVGSASFTVAVLFDEAMTSDGSADPTLTFDPTVASTLTFASDSWSGDSLTYTAVYDVADAGVDVTDVDITVSDALAADGDPQMDRTVPDLFSIDTENPLDVSHSFFPGIPVRGISDSQVGTPFIFGFGFNEVMTSDGSADPTIVFNPNVASTFSFNSGSWSGDDLTYSATYNVIDAGVDIRDIELTVNGAKDAAGNTQVSGFISRFDIDTENPTVMTVVPSDPLLSESDSGLAAFSIAVTYSEAMTDDGSTNPTLTFNPDASSVLTFSSGAWSSDMLTYTATYDVGNVVAPILDIDVAVTGATDAAGNAQVDRTVADVFDINVAAVINGDQDLAGQDDEIRLVRDAGNPNQLQIFLNGVAHPLSPLPLDITPQININGLGGNDTLIVDSSNGLISLSSGIRFDGGAGNDGLNIVQTGGSTLTGESLALGSSNGNGIHELTDAGGTQRVEFENIEPFTTNAVAPTFNITSVPNLASLLQDDNQINYEQGTAALLGPNAGRVTVDGFEPIEFINKTTLVIDAGAGSDKINLNNPSTTGPTSLMTIQVNAGDPTAGSDTVIVNDIDDTTDIGVSEIGTDSATIAGAQADSVEVTGAELLIIDGQGGGDDLTLTASANQSNRFVHTPGSATDAGRFEISNDFDSVGFLPIEYTSVSGVVTVDGNGNNGISVDALVLRGTEGDDFFLISGGGAPNSAAVLQTTVDGGWNLGSIDVPLLAVEALAGNDLISGGGIENFSQVLGGMERGGLFISGGDSDAMTDTFAFTGEFGTDDDITISPDATIPSQTQINGLGGGVQVQGIERILYGGNDGDQDDLTVNLGLGEATARVQHAAAANSDEVISDRLPTIQFSGVDDFVLDGGAQTTMATFVADFLPAAGGANTNRLEGAQTYLFDSNNQDVLIIEGESDNDQITVSVAGTNLQINDTDVTISTRGMNANDLLRIETKGGDDRLIVDVGGTGLVSTPIFFDGDVGADTLQVQGTPTSTPVDVRYTPGLQPDEGRLAYDDNDADTLFADMIINFDNLEPVVELVAAASLTVDGNGANNAISYTVGSTNNRGMVSVDGFETIDFSNKIALVLNGMQGDDTIVLNNSLTPQQLSTITVNAGDGADQVRLEALPVTVTANVNGDGGNDIIDASTLTGPTTLNGGAGDDTITGGAGVDTITGGSDDDTFVDSPGNDSYDGGTGNNTLLFRGTINNDVIDVTQTTPTAVTLSSDLDPTTFTTETLTLGTIDQLRIEALDGDDIIRVAHADAFSDNDLVAIPPNQSIRFEVQGNAPNASDRLVVQDLGLGDLVIHRVGADERSGSVTVGGAPNTLAPVDYAGIEFVDVTPLNNITGATGTDSMGQLVVFKSDPYEANNSLANATFLGAGATLNVDPTIDPAGIPAFGIPGDSDFYRFVAETTGTLDLQVYFEEIPTLNNGRPGLPNNGDLDIQLYDVAGNLIAGAGPLFGGNNGGGTNPELNVDGDAAAENERIRVPVVAGETYYLRVFGNVNAANVSAINVYSMTVLNEAPPVPFDLELNDIIQVGTVNNGVAPSATIFRANLAPVNGVLPPAGNDFPGKTVEFTSGPNIGRSATISTFNSVTGQFRVGPGLLTAPAPGDTFVIESTDTGRSQLDDTTRDNTPIITFRLNDNVLLNDLPGNPSTATPPDEVIPIPLNGATTAAATAAAVAGSAGFRVPVFIEGAPQQIGQAPLTPIGYAVQLFAGGVAVPGVYTFDFGTNAINGALLLADGSHFISAGVEIIDPAAAAQFGYGARSQSLEIVVDSTVPLISFGDPLVVNDGLHADSDTGVTGNAATLSDRITSDTTPTFFGQAEANSIVKAYVDVDGSGTITAADVLIGQTVAIPLDGTNQEPFGRWEITSAVNMNDPVLAPLAIDGPRTILVSAEDLAGNTSTGPTALTIFLDSQGPQITGVSVNQEATAPFGGYDLFDPKPSINGPSPLVNSITINFADLPARSDVAGTANDFLSPVLDPTIAGTIGNYSVVGDANGPIVITSATVNQAVRLSGTVTAAAVAGATTVTDAGLAAGTVVGDFIVFNNGGANGLTRRITNVAGGVLTIDVPFGQAQAIGDGFSIVPAASITHAGVNLVNSAAQATVTSLANTTTTFTASNLVTTAIAGDYVRFNTGVNAGQIRRVAVVDVTGTIITVANAFGMAPSAGDTITLIDPMAAAATALNTASVTLTFAEPLPDDRFTVTVSDNLVDSAGNQLDGESNATTPTALPTFPTGDGVPGGAFAGRFTIDTRPEIGVWAAGLAQIDINGNLQYDPENVDATNRDLDFQIGFSSDNIFAGKFGVSPVTGFATGFDTLAAYGRVGNQWRWMIDTNHDGTISATDIVNNDVLNINGMPVAGNFSTANPTDGDEIGVFDGSTWYLDTNRSFTIDAGDTTVGANYHGYPIVGDFNGDGVDDLGAYTAITNQFGGNLVSIDTNRDGLFDIQFRIGFGGGNANGFNMFPGVRERAVAADMDADGVDDIGFWVPDGTALNPGDQGEWYFLVSGGNSLFNRLEEQGNIDFLAYQTTPFGNDFKARFGNSFAVPLVGNFDPPVVASSGLDDTSLPTSRTTADPTTVEVTDTAPTESPTETQPEVTPETVAEAPVVEAPVADVEPEVVPPVAETEPEPTPAATPEAAEPEAPVVADPIVESVAQPESTPSVEEVSTPTDRRAAETTAANEQSEPVVEEQPAQTTEQAEPPVSQVNEPAPVEIVVETPILPPEPEVVPEQTAPEAEGTLPNEPIEDEVVADPIETETQPAVAETEPPALDQPGVPDSPAAVEVADDEPTDADVVTEVEPVVQPKSTPRRITSAGWWGGGRTVRTRVATPAPATAPLEEAVASTSSPVVPVVSTPSAEVAATPVVETPVVESPPEPVTTPVAAEPTTPTQSVATPPEVPTPSEPTTTSPVVESTASAAEPVAEAASTPEPAVVESSDDLQSMAFATSSPASSHDDNEWQSTELTTSDLAAAEVSAVDAAFDATSGYDASESLELDDDDHAYESDPHYKAFAELAQLLFG